MVEHTRELHLNPGRGAGGHQVLQGATPTLLLRSEAKQPLYKSINERQEEPKRHTHTHTHTHTNLANPALIKALELMPERGPGRVDLRNLAGLSPAVVA